MALGSGDLVFSAGTHLVTPLLDRLGPARAGGFDGVSVYPYEVEALRAQGVGDTELRARVADAGLAVGELDAVTNWLPDHQPPDTFPEPLGSLLRANTPEYLSAMAETIGARSLTLVQFYGDTPDTGVAAEAFAAACDVAAEHGVLVHLEFLPWGGIPDLMTAWDIVREADRPNGGLLVDNWHFARSGSRLDDLLGIPSDKILYVQLSDAPALAEDDLAEETQHRRLPPGEGELDIDAFLGALQSIGIGCPIGAEVFSDVLNGQPIEQVAASVGAATAAAIAKATRP